MYSQFMMHGQKNIKMHWIPILLVLRLYMFRAAFLPIIRSS